MVQRYAGNIIQFQSDLDITFDILKIVSPNYANVTPPGNTKPVAKTANSGSSTTAPVTRASTKKG
jgi:hypothetical protein